MTLGSEALDTLAMDLADALLRTGAGHLSGLGFGEVELQALRRVWQSAFEAVLEAAATKPQPGARSAMDRAFTAVIEAEGLAGALLDLPFEGHPLSLRQIERHLEIQQRAHGPLLPDANAILISLTQGLTEALLAEAGPPDSPLSARVSMVRIATLCALLKKPGESPESIVASLAQLDRQLPSQSKYNIVFLGEARGIAIGDAARAQVSSDLLPLLEESFSLLQGMAAERRLLATKIDTLLELVGGVGGLSVDYANRIRNFLVEYLGTPGEPVPFGGRQQQLAELDRWLADPSAQPYCLIAAQAGRGKSALLARWVDSLIQRDLARVVFVPISIRFNTAEADVTFTALAARLGEEYGHPVKWARLTSQQWREVCLEYLSRRPPDGRPLLVVLDGLDEAADWEAGPELFPRVPPVGVRIVVSARYLAGDVDERGWLDRLGWNPGISHALPLPPLTRDGVSDVLAAMGHPLDHLATQVDVVSELFRLSQGDPLLVRLYVEALLPYGDGVAAIRPEELPSIEEGLSGYFERWWEDQERQWEAQRRDPLAERESLLDFLNVCAAALGPLAREDVAEVAGGRLASGLRLRRIASDVARFVIGDGQSRGYVFSHPRLGQFFWEEMVAAERASWEDRFLAYGRRTLEALNAGQMPADSASAYPLHYFGAHLERARAEPEALWALVSAGWLQGWHALEGTYAGFLNDVERAWRSAEVQGKRPAHGATVLNLSMAVRCALCHSSVTALSAGIPVALLCLAQEYHVLTPLQTLILARQIPDERTSADALVAIAPGVRERSGWLMEEVLAAVLRFESEMTQAWSLGQLASHLNDGLRGQAWQAARSLADPRARALALAALVPHLAEQDREAVLRDALRAVVEIPDQKSRSRALRTLCDSLPPESDLIHEALAVAEQIRHPRSRSRAFEGLVSLLPLPARDEAVKKARQAADEVQELYSRTLALAELAPHLDGAVRGGLLQEILGICLALEEEKTEAVLSRIASHLSPELLEEAVHAVLGYAEGGPHGFFLDPRDRFVSKGLSWAGGYRALAPDWVDRLPGETLMQNLVARLEAGHETLDAGQLRAALVAALEDTLGDEAAAREVSSRITEQQIRRLAQSLRQYLEYMIPYSPQDPDDGQPDGDAYATIPGFAGDELRVLYGGVAWIEPFDVEGDPYLLRLWDVFVGSLGPDWLDALPWQAFMYSLVEELDPDLETLEPEQLQPAVAAALRETLSIELYRQVSEQQIRSLAQILLDYSDRFWIPREEASRRALQSQRQRFRPGALAILLEFLPPSSREEICLQVRDLVQTDAPDVQVLAYCALVPYLPQALLEEAAETADRIEDPFARAATLTFLLPHLSRHQQEEIYPDLAASAQALPEEAEQVQVLTEIAALPLEFLPDAVRIDLLRGALDAAQAINDRAHQVQILHHLAQSLSGEPRDAAMQALLAEIARMRRPDYKAQSLLDVMPLLPEATLPQVQGMVKAMQGSLSADALQELLTGLVPRLPVSARAEVLADVLVPEGALFGRLNMQELFGKLAVYIPPSLMGHALRAATVLEAPEARLEGLLRLAPYVAGDAENEVYRQVRVAFSEVSDLSVLVHVLSQQKRKALLPLTDELLSLAQSLPASAMPQLLGRLLSPVPEELRRQALQHALEASRGLEPSGQAELLMSISRHLPPDMLEEALSEAESIRDGWSRFRALQALMSRLSPELQVRAGREMLAVTRGLGLDHYWIGTSLLYQAQHLPESLLVDVFEEGRALKDDALRVRVLTALAPRVPEPVQSQCIENVLETLSAVQKAEARVPDGEWDYYPEIWDSQQAEALRALAPYLPNESQGSALQFARAIRWPLSRVEMLVALAPHLTEDLGDRALQEALAATRRIDSEKEIRQAFSLLGRAVPGDAWKHRLVGAAAEIAARALRVEALSALARHLPERPRAEVLRLAFDAADSIPERGLRAQACARLASLLPATEDLGQMQRWLDVILGLGDTQRRQGLGNLAPRLATWAGAHAGPAYELWTKVLREISKRPRPAFLDELDILLPYPLALTKCEEKQETVRGLLQAIQDVCTWWP